MTAASTPRKKLGKASNSLIHPANPAGPPESKTSITEPQSVMTPPQEVSASTPNAVASSTARPAPATSAPAESADGGQVSVQEPTPVVGRPVTQTQPAASAAKPATQVRTQERTGDHVSRMRLVDPLPAPLVPVDAAVADQPPAELHTTRTNIVSKRGKRDYNYSFPKEDANRMRDAYAYFRPLYRRHWKTVHQDSTRKLVLSTFLAHALHVAFLDPPAWLGMVRNDARKEPVLGGREQMGLVWPVEVEEQVVDLFESLDRSPQFPEGFSLTKQHMVAAAILYGLSSAEDWFLDVRNDDRYSPPTQADGRLRTNKAAKAVAGSA